MRKLFEKRRTYKQIRAEHIEDQLPHKINKKIAIFGPTKAGKTSLVHHLVGKPTGQPAETIGASYYKDSSHERIAFDYWDIGGSKRYEGLWPMYLRNADQVILTFDSSDLESFEQLNDYLEFAEKSAPKAKIVLVGINHNPEETPKISSEMIKAFKKKHHIFSYHAIEAGEKWDVQDLYNHLMKQAQPNVHADSSTVEQAKELANDSIQTLRSLAETHSRYKKIILSTCDILEGALVAKNINAHLSYNQDLLQEHLENLRYAPSSLYSTAYNTFITVLVCCAVLSTAFIALHWLKAILKENYAQKGDHFLFSTSGAKQQMQEAQHKTEDILRVKK